MNPRFAAYKELMDSHYIMGKWLAVHTQKDPTDDITSGNHHVIAAVHHKFMALMDNFNWEDQREAESFIESTRDLTGVFNRAATKIEDQAHDDILALCATAFYLNMPRYAGELEAIGNRWTAGWMTVWRVKIPMMFKWYYDNTEETPEIQFKKWFGRFLWLPGFMRVCMKRRGLGMNWWHRVNYMAYLLANAWFEKDDRAISGRQLRWLTTDIVYRQKYPLVNWAIRTWRKKQEEIYGPAIIGSETSGWNVPMGIFHGPTGSFRHPFSIYGNDVWNLECQDDSTSQSASATLNLHGYFS